MEETKQKRSYTKRGERFYIALVDKINSLMKVGDCIKTKDMYALVKDVSDELGLECKNPDTPLQLFFKIFPQKLEFVRGKKNADGGFSCSYVLREELDEKKVTQYFHKRDLTLNISSNTKQGREIRDARLRIAEELKMKDSVQKSQEYYITEANKLVHLTKLKVVGMASILMETEINGLGNVSSTRIKELVGSLVNKQRVLEWKTTLNAFGCGIDFKIITSQGRTWKLQSNVDPQESLEKLQELAKRQLGLDLDISRGDKPKVLGKVEVQKAVEFSRKCTDDYTKRIKILVFTVAGIVKSGGGIVSFDNILSVLKNNHYRRYDETASSLREFVSAFPEYFKIVEGTKVCLASPFYSDNLWNEIKQKFHPDSITKEIAWFIKSGLTLKEIKNFFPKSYVQDGFEGTGIVIIKMSESVKDFMNLARLYGKMRDGDKPILSGDLVDLLKNESSLQWSRLEQFYENDQKIIPEWAKKVTVADNDKLLYAIENTL